VHPEFTSIVELSSGQHGRSPQPEQVIVRGEHEARGRGARYCGVQPAYLKLGEGQAALLDDPLEPGGAGFVENAYAIPLRTLRPVSRIA
jgi:hypothetical protein